VTCSTTDTAENTGSTSFSVIITDSTAPVVAAVANISLEATGALTTASYSTTASDLVDGVVVVTCDPVSGTGFAVGTTSVACSATDAIGNIGSTSFDVIITDSTAPIVAAVSNISLEATGAQTTVTYSTTASDLVDGAVAVTCDPVSGTGFAVGTTSVTCSATDTIGNTGSTSFNVIVNDGTPPSLSTVANITTEATGAGTTVTFALPAAIDLVNGALVASCSPASGTDFIVGTTVVNCSASDSNGNTGTSSFTVMVEDTTAPSVKAVDDITVEAIGPTTGVEYLTSALDLVDGTMATSCLPISGSAFDVGTTPVTCSATDANFNTGSTSFNVIVTDTTAPVVDEQADITAYADSPAGATVEYTVGATDLVDGAVSTSCSPASPNTFAMGETTVTCTATDGSGNEGTGSFAVKVYYGSFIGMDVPNGMSIEGGDGDTRLDLGETAVGSYSRSIPLYWQYGDTTGASMDSGSADPTAHIDRFSTLEDGSCDFLSDPIDAGDSGNSGMRYTSSSQSWKYSWKPANGPGCYGITIESGLTGQENGPYLFELR